jgi:uncharacterized protein YegL
MSGKKIATLNQAIREALPDVRRAVAANQAVQIRMRAIKFADSASWHVGPQAMPLDQFVWPELRTAGITATAQAIRLLAAELTTEKMPRRGFPPVCILLSDGHCTDPQEAYDRAIADLVALPWGKRAVRLAIAIGDEADYDEAELLKFVSHQEIGVLKAHNPGELVNYIKWASVAATVVISQGKTRPGGLSPDDPNVLLTPPPQPVPTTNTDVF